MGGAGDYARSHAGNRFSDSINGEKNGIFYGRQQVPLMQEKRNTASRKTTSLS